MCAVLFSGKVYIGNLRNIGVPIAKLLLKRSVSALTQEAPGTLVTVTVICFGVHFCFFTAERMFWTDSSVGEIEMYKLDGSERRVIYSTNPEDIVGCSIDENFIYTIDNG